MKILYLDDYELNRLDPDFQRFLEHKVKGKWIIEDNWGHKYYGCHTKQDAEKIIRIKKHDPPRA